MGTLSAVLIWVVILTPGHYIYILTAELMDRQSSSCLMEVHTGIWMDKLAAGLKMYIYTDSWTNMDRQTDN